MIAQLVMTAAFALVALPFDVVVAYSVLLGGLCCVIPGAFSAYRMSVPTVRVSEAATHVWMAQGGKLALTVLMLIVVFSSVEPLAAVFFFGTMLVVQTAYALEPMLTRAATQRMTDRLIQE